MTEAAIAPGRDERRGFVVGVVGRRETLAARRRRENRHQEYLEQAKIIGLLKELLPAGTFFTALENRPRSRWSAVWQKRRGVRAGLTDILIVVRGLPPIFLETKSPRGLASDSQKQIRAELLATENAVWIMARSARAALVGLQRVGVEFCRPWEPPELQAWEGPFFDPHRRLPQHPEVRAERAAALKRWRLRRKQKAAEQAAAALNMATPAIEPH